MHVYKSYKRHRFILTITYHNLIRKLIFIRLVPKLGIQFKQSMLKQ